ncbi:MAG: TetR family transcriptional regulator [Parvibaculum sp.]|nr:TetR family transcriptional regulator [Parvibaculum sp.]
MGSAYVKKMLGNGTSFGKADPMISPWIAEKKEKSGKQMAKRRALLKTSARFFKQNGFHETTLDDLARELGIGKGTLYHYIKSKNDILYEVQSIAIKEIETAIESALANPGTALDRIRKLLHDYASILADDFGACLVTNGVHALEARNRDEILSAQLRLTEALRQLVAEGIEDSSIVPCDPLVACAALSGAIMNLAYWYDPGRHEPLSEVVDGMIRILFDGLASRPGRRRKGSTG